MAGNHWIAVNKSGVQIPVYSGDYNTGSRIGTIYNGEMYGITGIDEGDSRWIQFRNASGALQNGFISVPSMGDQPISFYAASDSASVYIPEEGTSWIAHKYMTRKSLNAIKADNTFWATVPSGSEIYAVSSYEADNGVARPTYLKFNGYRSPDGVWHDAPGADTYGYIDTGIAAGSGFGSTGIVIS